MRLIDADALINNLSEKEEEYSSAKAFETASIIHWIKTIYIDNLPTVDAEPVIRCKDCKYFSQNDRWCERYECDEGCSLICWDLGEDGFCSKAEERIYCKDCKYFKLGKCYWRGDFEEAEKMNGVEIIREYPQPANMNDWCGNGVQR